MYPALKISRPYSFRPRETHDALSGLHKLRRYQAGERDADSKEYPCAATMSSPVTMAQLKYQQHQRQQQQQMQKAGAKRPRSEQQTPAANGRGKAHTDGTGGGDEKGSASKVRDGPAPALLLQPFDDAC